MSANKTGLVVLYNHNYEKNIDRIRRIYGERFSQMRQLMPFYYGNEPDVIRVFGNSFQFHAYIAQACDKLMEMDCDSFLIIGDDLLLNPVFNENNVHEQLRMAKDEFYLDEAVEISKGDHIRAVEEAQKIDTHHPGLDASASRIVPGFDEARDILKARGVLDSTTLPAHKPLLLKWRPPFWSNLRANLGYTKSNIYQHLLSLSYRIMPRKMVYPCVFGYSDIFVVPRIRMREFCDYLEVFAAWRMFVELAIPTAVLLLKDSKVKYLKDAPFKPGNVWFPNNMEHHNRMNAVIQDTIRKAQGKVELLPDAFPSEYLYLHPVKLSMFK